MVLGDLMNEEVTRRHGRWGLSVKGFVVTLILTNAYSGFDAFTVKKEQCKVNGAWAHSGHNYGPNTKEECLTAISAVATCNQKIFIHKAGEGCYCFSDLNIDEKNCTYDGTTGYFTYRTYMSTFTHEAASITALRDANTAYKWTGTDAVEWYTTQVANGLYGLNDVVTAVKQAMVDHQSGGLDMAMSAYTVIADHTLASSHGIATLAFSGAAQNGTQCAAKLFLALAVCPQSINNISCAECTDGLVKIQQSMILTKGTDSKACSVWFLKIDGIARVSVTYLRANWLGTRVNTCTGRI